MHSNSEAGRAAGRDRASNVVLCRNASEVAHPDDLVQRIVWIAARRPVGNAVARCLAEHAFGLVHSRASR